MKRADPPPGALPPGARWVVRQVSGSRAHGTHTALSDWDRLGVYALPPDELLGTRRHPESTGGAPEGTWYELSHYGHLVAKGNPNIVEMLFAHPDAYEYETPEWGLIQSVRPRIVSRQMAQAYVGWCHSELKRPDLRGKRLAHVPRLAWELMSAIDEGEPVVRLTGYRLQVVLSIKRGELPTDEALALSRTLVAEVERKAAGAALPDAPHDEVHRLVVAARLSLHHDAETP